MLSAIAYLACRDALTQDIVVPRPATVVFGSGTHTFQYPTSVGYWKEYRNVLEPIVRRSMEVLAARGTASRPQTSFAEIKFNSDPKLPREGYRLVVDSSGASVFASSAAGFQYGGTTLLQWLEHSSTVPFMDVTDQPRFKWRGLHLDCSRHFFTVPEIKTYIDDMARYKFNVFHWHLVDDGGWRIEIKKYPKLTDVGAWRVQHGDEVWNGGNLEFPGKDSSKPLYGGFYTQDQIREIVKYAQDRSVQIVPEIEMPGHCIPAVLAYPDVTCTVDKRPGAAYRTTVYCAGKDRTYAFLGDVLDEVMKLFPSKVIHIGGDEVDQQFWTRCPDCQARIKSEGLKDTHQLQSYFVKRMEKYLNSKGRSLMGWDEILEGGLAPNAQVMSWRGIQGGIAAAKSGHDVVMSPTSHCYFDFSYDGTSTEHVYGFEPVPGALNATEAKHVLGGQANIWTEWMPNFAKVQTMIFPRMMAMSEVLWSSAESRNWPDFQRRMPGIYDWLVREKRSFFVEPPKAVSGLIVFNGTTNVNFTHPEIPGYELRYTTDGSEPKPTSALYKSGVSVSSPCVVRASGFIKGRPLPGEASVKCQAAHEGLTSTGMKYRLITRSFDAIPKFDGPSDGDAENFSIAPFAKFPAFAIEWRGTLKIEKEGLYKFTLTSDDGSGLWIDDANVINHDGPHALSPKSGTAILQPGYYPFTVRYFDQGGARGFKATYEGPNGSGLLEKLVVPKEK